MKNLCLFGLSNYGLLYKYTRHNVGGLFINSILRGIPHTFLAKTSLCHIYNTTISSRSVYVCLPRTKMNVNGSSAKGFLDYIKCPSVHFIIFQDDIDRSFLSIRVKDGKGTGGHNGVRSIKQYINQNNITRVCIGVGRPAQREHVKEYVLSNFSKRERSVLGTLFESMRNNIDSLLQGEWNSFENSIVSIKDGN